MKLTPAIGTTYDYSINIENMLESISASGFKFISLGMKLDHSNYHTPEGRSNLVKLTEKNNLTIESIHADYLNENADIASLDKAKRHRGVDDFSQIICAAYELNCPLVIFHPHRRYDTLDNHDKRIDAVLESVDALIQIAQNSDVHIAVENLFTIGSDQILDALFARFSPDELGFCYDSSHDNITSGNDFGELLNKYGSWLAATHISDNMGKNDDHMIPYTGKIDFSKFVQNFPIDTYKGNLLLETEIRMHPELKKLPQDFLKQSFDAATRLRNELLSR